MQSKNWNDLRFVLALKRGQSLAAAARLLDVDDTTVSRRLNALQQATGTRLFERRADGVLHLTPDGEAAAHHAEAMEHQMDLLTETLGSDREGVAGVVRLTSVPIVINRLLTPRIGGLLEAHPDLEVELIPDSRDFSLTRREADLAIRLARPATGGSAVKARRIGHLEYGVYASHEVLADDVSHLPWITYEDAMAHIPQARWVARTARGRGDAVSGVRVHDAETAFEAAVAGLGRAVLPSLVADQDERLCRATPASEIPPLSRELWLLAHADQLELRRIAAVIAWIETTVSGPQGEDQSCHNQPRASR